MKTKNIITALLLLCLSTSCEKWFDVTPKTEMKASVLFSTEAGFRDALIGIYAAMAQKSLYGTDLTLAYSDVLAQTYDNVKSNASHVYKNSVVFKYTELDETARIENIWKQMYKAIAEANIILANIDDNKDVFKENNFNIVKGEALGLRALIHFDLLRLFAPSPVTGLDKKAIPYVDQFSNVAFPQLTLDQTFLKIVSDINAARSLLKDADPWGPKYASFNQAALPTFLKLRNNRLNYYAVTGLLARVLLYKGDKTNALVAAREVIDSGIFPLYQNSSFISENLFAISKPDTKSAIVDVFFPKVTDVYNYSFLTIKTTNYTAIYTNGVDQDYRLNWFESLNSTDTRIKKYDNIANIPVLKVSEMYLIAAESELNTKVAFSSYLNILKAYRGLSPIDPNSTATILSTEINKEYRKEFVAEGQLFFYYKRLYVNKLPTITAFASNEAVYNLPIPVSEKEFGNYSN